MSESFDSYAIANRGWRQGAILGPALAKLVREHAPEIVDVNSTDWLILMSHDCDIVNRKIEKEPVVEILQARVVSSQEENKQHMSGRNPRMLQFVTHRNGTPFLLSCTAYARWVVPRDLLMNESAEGCLSDRERRLVADWLAKRYTRTAFPTAFDGRWRSKQKDWEKLLKRYSEWLQGVYIHLNTMDELSDAIPYRCEFILAVPHSKRGDNAWASQREQYRGGS